MNARLFGAAVSSILLIAPGFAVAQSEIVRIEEDWELAVVNPDQQRDAPQVTVSMAPFSNSPDLHLQVNLNYALKPDFATGGIQVRIQKDDITLANLHRKSGVQLSHSSELVTWTSVIQKTETGYAFGVRSGTGASWGSFGGDSYFLFLSGSTTSGGLKGYTPDSSLENSGVTFARNRVTSLRLKRFRAFDSNGLVGEFLVNADVQ